MDLTDIRTVKNIMAGFGLRFRKEFGQNFLTDASVLCGIADAAAEENDAVLEIGPGIGTLTRELAARYGEVIAVEIDRALIPVLEYTLHDFPNVRVINEDILKTDLAALLSPYFEKGRVSVAANLPYYITTPILMELLESGLPFHSITAMMQTEVAERLTAPAGDGAYGAITVAVNYYGTAERLFDVSPESFLPAPSVTSTVVRIKPHRERPFRPADEAIFKKTVRAAFAQRRKTLPNALSAGFPLLGKERCTDLVLRAGHRADIRGERLSVEEFVALSDLIAAALCEKENAK